MSLHAPGLTSGQTTLAELKTETGLAHPLQSPLLLEERKHSYVE